MPKKRANNEGTIYQRKDGRWMVQVTVGHRRVTRYAKTKDDALKVLASLRVQQFQGTLSLPSDLTLDDWVEQWLALVEPDLRPSTIAMYRKTLDYTRRIVGGHRLDKLTPLLLTQAFSQLQRETKARRQLALAHGYLRACLERAVDLDLIAVNPMAKVKKPTWRPRDRTYWAIDEAHRFIQTGLTIAAHWNAMFVFMVTTGLRISETLGLQWEDLDEGRKRIRVERAIVWDDIGYSVVPPKSKAGKRWVSLPGASLSALALVTAPREREAPIFRSMRGTVPKAQNLRAPLARLCEKSQVPIINLHGLRHVAAMLALEATGDAYLVQQRLGHSHVTTTLGIYGYPARPEATVSEAMDQLLSNRERTGVDGNV
jgi:integrase